MHEYRAERWVTVLAGGDGVRLGERVAREYDDGRPKQFAALGGGPTLVERTLNRARLATRPSRCLVCLGRQHLPWRDQLSGIPDDQLSVEPRSRGTGVAALVAAARISRVSPDATVVLLPSDHHVTDDLAFMGHVCEAVAWVERHPEQIVVLGVPARSADTGYGWLVPRGHMCLSRPSPATLLEKPGATTARVLLETEALWSTMVVVYSVRSLLALVAALAPSWWWAAVGKPWRDEAELEAAFETLGPVDFSADLLARAGDHIDVLPVWDVGWADVGTEERLREAMAAPTPTYDSLCEDSALA